ncbi:MAG TPA: MMPL family transporter, partial [Burkholderiales bacterium]|nr:MMPL family transporter [Burkholderiales bacterium]
VSRLILVGVEGAPAPVLAGVSRRVAAELRGDQRFVSVDNGEDAGNEKDREFLWRHRYLLSPAVAAHHFSATGMRERLEESLRLLGSPAGIFIQRILPNDPTGELVGLVERLSGQARPEMRDGVWFSRDGARALLLAQTSAPGYDIDAQEDATRAIRAAFTKAVSGSREVADTKLVLTGPGVFSVSSRERIKGDATRISLIATALIAALLLALYRSVRVLILGLLPVATGALGGVAAVSLGFGSVHGITLGFGATLIGEGVDYAIYLFTQVAPGIPPHETLNRIWPTLRLGVLTSICGFSAMLFSGFTGLAQLGLFSIVGLITAVTVTRFVLPALLPAGFSARPVTALAPRVIALVRRAPAMRYPALLLITLSVAAAAASSGATWGDDLASLSPVSAAEQKLDEQLRRDMGAPDVRHIVVVSGPDEQAVLEASEDIVARLDDLRARDVLEGFDAPTFYLPSVSKQRARQAAIPAQQDLREDLRQAARGLPFRTDLFEPFLQDIEAARAMAPITHESLHGTRLGLKLDSLLMSRGKGWVAMLPLRGVRDVPALTKEMEAVPNGSALVLDVKRAADELYEAYLREVVRNALLGAAAILALLFLALRSPRRVIDVIVPLAAAVALTASAILLSGSRLSIFHVVGLLLVVAVGSNYSLFFDRETPDSHERERIIVSVLFANIATVIGFGLLSFSHVPILHAIGSTVGIGAILSLVFAAIFIANTTRHPTAKVH